MALLAHHGIDGRDIVPWYLPSPDGDRGILEGHRFDLDSIELIPRPTPLPTNMRGRLDTVAASLFAALKEPARADARRQIVQLLPPVLCDRQRRWMADYARLRFAGHRRWLVDSACTQVQAARVLRSEFSTLRR